MSLWGNLLIQITTLGKYSTSWNTYSLRFCLCDLCHLHPVWGSFIKDTKMFSYTIFWNFLFEPMLYLQLTFRLWGLRDEFLGDLDMDYIYIWIWTWDHFCVFCWCQVSADRMCCSLFLDSILFHDHLHAASVTVASQRVLKMLAWVPQIHRF